jgi:hypothetical protein
VAWKSAARFTSLSKSFSPLRTPSAQRKMIWLCVLCALRGEELLDAAT